MENLENEIADSVQEFYISPTSKTKSAKVESTFYHPNEEEIVRKAQKAGSHLVCSAYGITPEQLNEILSRHNNCNC